MIDKYEDLLTEEFIDKIECLKWCNGVEYFKVIYSKANKMLSTNIVRSILIVPEDNILFFDDEDNILLTNDVAISPIEEISIKEKSTYEFEIRHNDYLLIIEGLEK